MHHAAKHHAANILVPQLNGVVLQLVWARPPLRSLLPATPLQPPDTWAWGSLVNGRVFTADTGPRGTFLYNINN